MLRFRRTHLAKVNRFQDSVKSICDRNYLAVPRTNTGALAEKAKT